MEQTNQSTKLNQPKYYRFRVMKEQIPGQLEKPKTVGMAYLREGHEAYTIRLWTFVNEKFFMVMDKHDSSRFLLMSRELNRKLNSGGKYFWNVIGNGRALSAKNVIELNFDLFPGPIYLDIFPEE